LKTAWWTDKTGERREQEGQGEDVVSGITRRWEDRPRGRNGWTPTTKSTNEPNLNDHTESDDESDDDEQ
jgi:hypothetical protein